MPNINGVESISSRNTFKIPSSTKKSQARLEYTKFKFFNFINNPLNPPFKPFQNLYPPMQLNLYSELELRNLLLEIGDITRHTFEIPDLDATFV